VAFIAELNYKGRIAGSRYCHLGSYLGGANLKQEVKVKVVPVFYYEWSASRPCRLTPGKEPPVPIG
jgi:hypothetical protein